jgi:hypothetical protein
MLCEELLKRGGEGRGGERGFEMVKAEKHVTDHGLNPRNIVSSRKYSVWCVVLDLIAVAVP